MRTRFFILLMLIFFGSNMQAQRQVRIGYIDMDYILENMPTYQEANQQLNQKIIKWKNEIELKRQKIEDLKEQLENERPLLTRDLIQEQLDEIEYRQQKLLAYQQKRFGPQGDVVAQRRQIIQPIQDQVFNAIQQIGKKREYDFIFDGSADALMLFSAPRHDISDEVLAIITRNTNIQARAEAEKSRDKQELKKSEPVYKSVRQARIEKEREEERQKLIEEREAERQAEINRREQRRDSINAARNKARELMLKKRQQRRDSILNARQNARQQMLRERQQQRDSINRARQKARENR